MVQGGPVRGVFMEGAIFPQPLPHTHPPTEGGERMQRPGLEKPLPLMIHKSAFSDPSSGKSPSKSPSSRFF